MWKLYEGFVTVHKEVVRLHGPQQQSKESFKTLKNIQAFITYMQEWTM